MGQAGVPGTESSAEPDELAGAGATVKGPEREFPPMRLAHPPRGPCSRAALRGAPFRSLEGREEGEREEGGRGGGAAKSWSGFGLQFPCAGDPVPSSPAPGSSPSARMTLEPP